MKKFPSRTLTPFAEISLAGIFVLAWNAILASQTSLEARATVSKSMQGRRRDPRPLFYHRCRCRRCRRHPPPPPPQPSLFGNLSSDSVQLSSVAPLGRVVRVLPQVRVSSRTRRIHSVSFFSRLVILLSFFFYIVFHIFSFSLLSFIFYSRERKRYVKCTYWKKKASGESAASRRCFFPRRSTIVTR